MSSFALRRRLWKHTASLPAFRYPTPFSLPNATWSVTFDDERPVIEVRIADRRWRLRLKGGFRYRRRTASIRDLLDHGVKGSLDFYQRRIDGADRVLCKMVGWLPREPRSAGNGTMFVRTTGESMMIAVNTKEEKLWQYHGDQIRRWSAEHRRQLRLWADDTKSEQRPVPPFRKRREGAAAKYHNRMSERRRKQAEFRDPQKTLDNFDFDFNKKINRSLVFDLATGPSSAGQWHAQLPRPEGVEKASPPPAAIP